MAFDDTLRIFTSLRDQIAAIARSNVPFGLPRVDLHICDCALRDSKIVKTVKDNLSFFMFYYYNRDVKYELKDDKLSLTISTQREERFTEQPEQFAFFLGQLTFGRALPILLDVYYYKERANKNPERIVAHIIGCSRLPEEVQSKDHRIIIYKHHMKLLLPTLTMKGISLPRERDIYHHSESQTATENTDRKMEIQPNEKPYCFLFNVFSEVEAKDPGKRIEERKSNLRAGNFLTILMSNELYIENRDMLLVSNHRKEYLSLLIEMCTVPSELAGIILGYCTLP